jgi:hypothetical protein
MSYGLISDGFSADELIYGCWLTPMLMCGEVDCVFDVIFTNKAALLPLTKTKWSWNHHFFLGSSDHIIMASSYKGTTPANPDTTRTQWLRQGYINDKFSSHCQRAQGRHFLRTGNRPCHGARIELTLIISSDERAGIPFRMSGEVVEVGPMPVWKESGDGTAVVHDSDGGGDDDARHVYRLDGCADGNDGDGDGKQDTTQLRPSITTANSQKNHYWRPCTLLDDCGPNGGSYSLAQLLRASIPSDRLLSMGSDLNSVWERLPEESKKHCSNVIVKKLGARHGQRIVCEGRRVS